MNKNSDDPFTKAAQGEGFLHLVFSQVPLVIWTVDKDLIFRSSFGKGLQRLGLEANTVVGTSLWEFFTTRDAAHPAIAAHMKALQGESVNFISQYLSFKHDAYVEPLKNVGGEIIGVIGVAIDITNRERTLEASEPKEAEERLRRSLDEKDTLLRELHHRVKNNLQMIIALIRLQLDSIEDPSIVELFSDIEGRIRTISLVHETLHQSESLNQISLNHFLEQLAQNIFNALTSAFGIELHIEVAEISVTIEAAISCGLLVNELLSNAFKYAFPEGKANSSLGEGAQCTVTVLAKEDDNGVTLQVIDNGIGIPPNQKVSELKSLGLYLVNILAKNQLKGEVHFENHTGTSVTITFPNLEENGQKKQK